MILSAGGCRKRPVDTAAINEKAERTEAVLHISRHGTREELRALLKGWDYSTEDVEAILKTYDAALEQQSS